MKTRGLAIMVAFLLAIGATSAVYMYIQGVRRDAKGSNSSMVSVIVSKQDIPAQTNLDNLISGGAFTTLRVPVDAVVQGAVTDLSQLKGKSTAFPILQSEQISTARLQGSSTQVEGGALGIPAGHKALTLPVELPQAVGGVLQAGDHITLYATFDNVSLITPSLRRVLQGQAPKKHDIGELTATLVPDVQVLKVSQSSDGNGGTVLLTLALTPVDAPKVVLSQEEGKIWVALLPPGETGTPMPPVNGIEVLK
jgi:pilus assembly protein CpaB